MEHSNRILLLIASAVGYSFAFPPFGWWPLALLGVGVLAGILHGTHPVHGLIAGCVWGMVAFGSGLSWMWTLFGPFCILLWGILAVFPALFGWLVCIAQQRGITTGWRLVLFIALAWTATEFIRCELMPLKFPWLNLGLSLEPWPFVSSIGVYGLGFVAMLALASVIFGAHRSWLATGVLLLVANVEWMGNHDQVQFFRTVKAAAVQVEGAPVETCIALANKAPADTQLIVWPENALPIDVCTVAPDKLATVQAFALQKKALLVFGTQTRLEGPHWQNTVLTIDGSTVLGEHGKNHTVHFFSDGEHGKTALPVATPLGRIGTPICFDCDFQDVVREMTLAGAELFAVPSMDAAGWPARQHIQHCQLFRVRAAENRRCILVAASSGVSQFIDANGECVQSLPPMKTGIIHGSIERRKEMTFFTRTGWRFPWAILAALGFWTFWLLAFQDAKMPQPPAP